MQSEWKTARRRYRSRKLYLTALRRGSGASIRKYKHGSSGIIRSWLLLQLLRFTCVICIRVQWAIFQPRHTLSRALSRSTLTIKSLFLQKKHLKVAIATIKTHSVVSVAVRIWVARSAIAASIATSLLIWVGETHLQHLVMHKLRNSPLVEQIQTIRLTIDALSQTREQHVYDG